MAIIKMVFEVREERANNCNVIPTERPRRGISLSDGVKFLHYFVMFGMTLLFTMTLPQPARAQETSASFAGGSIKLGYDPGTCDSTVTGAVRYNSAISNIELCDGSIWSSSSGSGANSLSGVFDTGSVKINYDGRTCDSSLEGSLRYNSATGIELCNGSAWTSISP